MDTESLGLKFAIAILLVGLAMAGFFAMVLVYRRRFPGGFFGAVPAFRGGSFLGQGRGRRERISVVETVQIDPRRRAILIRRDDREHLILVGGPTDVVIEGGIDAPYEAAEPEDDYAYQEPMEEVYEPEPPKPARIRHRAESVRPAERPAPQTYQDPYRTPYDEIDEDFREPETPSGQYLRPRAPAPSASADSPLSTGIRPVTLARSARSSADSAMDDEEAAIARELEAARRRTQIPAPQSPLGATRANGDFDDILAREMEERLEAAKRQARALNEQQRRPITQGRPPQTDQRSMQAGINRIFGDAGNEG